MALAFWIISLLSFTPVLGGLIDPQTASLFFFLAILALGIGSAWLIWNNEFKIPDVRLVGWATLLSLLSFISACFSPIPAESFIAWRSLVLGLWIIPLTTLIPESSRSTIDQAIFLSGYILCFYAVLQISISQHLGISSFLPNPNIFAGFIVFVLPLTLEKKKTFLAVCLALMLLATKSVGAWFSLAIAALILQRQIPRKIKTFAFFVFLACGVLIFRKPEFDFHNRWLWWRAALTVFLKRPWIGCGPGVFAYLLPLKLPAHLLRSLYAHQYYLQTAAECGINYLLIFLAGLFFLLPKSPMRRLAVLASLILGLWDYSLEVPAVFYLFCYIAASETPQAKQSILLSNLRFPAALLILVFSLALSRPAWARWREENLKSEAISLFNRNAPIEKVRQKFMEALSWAPDADAERLLAEIDFRQRDLLKSAAHWEKAAQENPCRPSTWQALSSLYQLTGNAAKAKEASLRSLNSPCP